MQAPDEAIDEQAEKDAIAQAGYPSDRPTLIAYRNLIRNMSTEKRSEIFFLKANDDHFYPRKIGKQIGKSILTELESEDGKKHFTDVALGDKKAYFIIAAPSTWPPFQ